MNITRKAILIIGHFELIHGLYEPADMLNACRDINRMDAFLKSSLGGSWNESDIIILKNPNYREITDCLREIEADYSLIYFTGHGKTRITGEMLIGIKDNESISITNLKTAATKQNIIIEACRNNEPHEKPQKCIIEEAHFLPNQIESTVQQYISHIYNAPPGIITVLSTQKGHLANSSINGGCFTQAMLKAATDWKETIGIKRVLTIHEAIDSANKILAPIGQKADITIPIDTSYTFPFAVR